MVLSLLSMVLYPTDALSWRQNLIRAHPMDIYVFLYITKNLKKKNSFHPLSELANKKDYCGEQHFHKSEETGSRLVDALWKEGLEAHSFKNMSGQYRRATVIVENIYDATA